MVDIIVPVYNALDFVKECIDSVIRHSNEYRLILIDDKSPDPAVWEYLNSIDHPNVIVLQNEENRGVVYTENRGIAMSNENDVIILNSDTVVTARWIEKLRECAYSDEAIGLVCPLTNSVGYILTVPLFYEDQDIPEGLDADSFNALIEKICLRESNYTPLGISFCMYVKRAVFNKIGLLDYETYGRGYYEESDFCLTAAEAGFANVKCNNTFIYHKGTASFQGAKNDWVTRNEKIYNERFPMNEMFVRNHCLNLSWAPTIENINFYLNFNNKQNNVLFLSSFHQLPPFIHDCNKFFLRTEGYQVILEAVNRFTLTFYIDKPNELKVFRNSEYAYIVEQIVIAFNIDTLIVSDMRGHTSDVLDICDKYGIKKQAQLNDCYFLSPTGDPNDGSEEVYAKIGYSKNFFGIWQEKVTPLLSRFDSLICNSRPVAEAFQREGYKLSSVFTMGKRRIITSEAFNPRLIFDAYITNGGNLIGYEPNRRFLEGNGISEEMYVHYVTTGKMPDTAVSVPSIEVKRGLVYRVIRKIYRLTLKKLLKRVA